MQDVDARATRPMALEFPETSPAADIEVAAGKKPELDTQREPQSIPFYRAFGNRHAIAS
jgi:hypothetical protein